MEKLKTRFAPSPTGHLHLGGARTALFNFLAARRAGGTFLLRIEDTDRARHDESAVGKIIDDLRWLGIVWDEGPDVGGPYGPYFQSERRESYRSMGEGLVASGAAYRCYCSPERLARMRQEQAKSGGGTGYDRRCRNLTDRERRGFEEEGVPSVIRLKVPHEGTTTFHDLRRGDDDRR